MKLYDNIAAVVLSASALIISVMSFWYSKAGYDETIISNNLREKPELTSERGSEGRISVLNTGLGAARIKDIVYQSPHDCFSAASLASDDEVDRHFSQQFVQPLTKELEKMTVYEETHLAKGADFPVDRSLIRPGDIVPPSSKIDVIKVRLPAKSDFDAETAMKVLNQYTFLISYCSLRNESCIRRFPGNFYRSECLEKLKG